MDFITSPPIYPQEIINTALMPLQRACQRSAQLVDQFLNSDTVKESTKDQVKLGLEVVEKALQEHDINEIALSFNGGKDCLVMLILFLAQLNNHPESLSKLTTMPSVFVHFDHSFKEVDEFVDQCKTDYSLEVTRLSPPLKNAFGIYLDKNPNIKAIFVGIRRTDPYGDKLTYYEKTDHGWPDFYRVHPVLEWHFVEVWEFIRFCEIPYCKLYDQGYTSLGGTDNTRKNPTLKLEQKDAQGNALYKPAYELTDDEKERLSRINNK